MLDTNICIFIRRERPKIVLDRFRLYNVGELVMSVITYGELRFGVVKANANDEKSAADVVLTRLTEMIPVLPMAEDVGDAYAIMRNYLQSRGEMIGNNDLWIAAHAMAADLTLVTNNRREFDRLGQMIHIQDWSEARAP